MVLVAGLVGSALTMAATPGSPGTATPNPYQTIQPRGVPTPAPTGPAMPGTNSPRNLPPATTVNPRDNGLPQLQQVPSTPKVKTPEPVKPKVE
jgi:hypothetical protein